MANKKPIGAVIKLDGEKEYKKALSEINADMKVFTSEMKKTAAQFSENAKGLKSLKEQTALAADAVEKQKEKIATMRGALEDATKKYGENSKEVKQWKVSLNNAEAELSKMEKSLKGLESQTKGLGKVKTVFNEWKEKLSEVKGKLSPIADELKKVASAAAKVASVSFKAFSAGVAAVSAGIVKIGKDAISAYSDTEQLKGGVETLFKNASSEVIKNANDAFKTAGMSANEYMENVTSFSASLISSVGGDTAKAAKIADQAIIDMSDNANKMGTDISSIQNAYQGFAKGNYTMLDNLKLGYGGTKEEMSRLLSDAEKLTGKKFDLSNFADITEAIHAIQNQYGITGTTAKEAAITIQGSISSMKSAYQNLLSGLADENADLDQLINNLIDSGFTVLKNVMPRIRVALSNIAESIKEYAPELINELVSGLSESLSPLLEAAISIVSALVESLTNEENLRLIIQAAVDLVLKLVDGLIENIEPIISAAFTVVTVLSEALLQDDNLTKLIEAAVALITTVTTGLIDHIPELISAGFRLVEGLIKGLWDNRGKIWDAIKQIAKSMISTIKQVLGIHSPSTIFADVGKNIIQGLINGIENAKQWVIDKVRGLGSSIISTAKNVLGIHSPSKEFEKLGDFTGEGFGVGFVKSMKSVKEKMKESIPTSVDSDIGVKLKADVQRLNGNYDDVVGKTESVTSSNVFNFNFSFNVNGNDVSDISALADRVADKIYKTTKAKMEAFA